MCRRNEYCFKLDPLIRFFANDDEDDTVGRALRARVRKIKRLKK